MRSSITILVKQCEVSPLTTLRPFGLGRWGKDPLSLDGPTALVSQGPGHKSGCFLGGNRVFKGKTHFYHFTFQKAITKLTSKMTFEIYGLEKGCEVTSWEGDG